MITNTSLLRLFLGCALVVSAHAGTIVAPNAYANANGGFNNVYPFDLSQGMPAPLSMRYQQVYASSQFGLAPFLITQLAFRPAPGSPAFGPTILPSVQIDLSTTSAGPGSLSATFANNSGANDLVVFNGVLTLSSAASGPDPKSFDIIILLSTPFLYNPNAGNLLLDVRNFTSTTTTRFDAAANTGVTARVYSATSVADTTGTTDALGLITQFQTTPVPEPGTLGLAGLGALLTWGRVIARKRL